MSWSESVAPLTRDEFASREPQSDQAKACVDQYEKVRDAAVALIDSEALGEVDGATFSGGLAGHVQAEGTAVPSVYISVSRIEAS